MGLLLSRSHLHCVNNSLQSAFYTDRLRTSMATWGGGGGGRGHKAGGRYEYCKTVQKYV